MNSLFPEYQEITPILKLGDYMIGKYKKVEKPKEKKKRGIVNERQAIIDEIAEIIKKESGAVNKKLLAIKFSHIPTEDLYYLKSAGLDYRNRGKGAFGKFVYGSIKVKKDI